ncbi:hypothetical protein MRB53_041469 [Persea americana]|nr:hypothetical protein MRB53_041469 [Persea americana]
MPARPVGRFKCAIDTGSRITKYSIPIASFTINIVVPRFELQKSFWVSINDLVPSSLEIVEQRVLECNVMRKLCKSDNFGVVAFIRGDQNNPMFERYRPQFSWSWCFGHSCVVKLEQHVQDVCAHCADCP